MLEVYNVFVFYGTILLRVAFPPSFELCANLLCCDGLAPGLKTPGGFFLFCFVQRKGVSDYAYPKIISVFNCFFSLLVSSVELNWFKKIVHVISFMVS